MKPSDIFRNMEMSVNQDKDKLNWFLNTLDSKFIDREEVKEKVEKLKARLYFVDDINAGNDKTIKEVIDEEFPDLKEKVE